MDFDEVTKFGMGFMYVFAVSALFNPGEHVKNMAISAAVLLFLAIVCRDMRIEGLDFLDPALLTPHEKVPRPRYISRIIVHYSDGSRETSYPSTVPPQWFVEPDEPAMNFEQGRGLLPL
jgi:hypothetical protein